VINNSGNARRRPSAHYSITMSCMRPSPSDLILAQAKDVIETVRHKYRAKGHEAVLLGMKDEKEAVRVLTNSFNGTADSDAEPIFDWVLGPELRGKHDHPLRIAFFRYYMRFIFLSCVKYGLVIGVRDTSTSELMACCGVLPPGRRHITDASNLLSPTMLSLFVAVGALPPDMIQHKAFPPHVTERVNAMAKAGMAGLEDCASQVGGKEGHFYVYAMATAPEAQGKGCTRTALEIVAAFADATGYPCALDSGSEKNTCVYQRLGYEVLSKHKISTKKELNWDNDSPEERFMARQADYSH